MSRPNKSLIKHSNSQILDFMWLELTNQCNLHCKHCYAESGPHVSKTTNLLNIDDYRRLIDEAYDLGCRNIQFIGGEPTLNKDLDSLINYAISKNYRFIEVFTNLTNLSRELIDTFAFRRVHVATSVYANVAGIHDRITTVPGSFARTITNIKKLVAAGVSIRVSVIGMDENEHVTMETIKFLNSLGVPNVGFDRLRKIGRGSAVPQNEMSELCGQCKDGRLCIGPDGLISPCIMSKAWAVGSVLDRSLAEVASSRQLSDIRSQIAQATQSERETACNPNRPNICPPDRGGGSTCNPNTHCGPNSCRPVR